MCLNCCGKSFLCKKQTRTKPSTATTAIHLDLPKIAITSHILARIPYNHPHSGASAGFERLALPRVAHAVPGPHGARCRH